MKPGLSEFETRLRELMRDINDLRPFVCEGDPCTCRIFIVGTNPATAMPQSFWTYWEAGSGFNRRRWLEDYRAARAARRTRGESIRLISPTRQRIEWLVEALRPYPCLETNVWAKPTRTAAELQQKERQYCILEFLLDAIRPAVVIAHGRPAHDFFPANRSGCEVIRVPHLFNASAVSVRQLAEHARNAIIHR